MGNGRLDLKIGGKLASQIDGIGGRWNTQHPPYILYNYICLTGRRLSDFVRLHVAAQLLNVIAHFAMMVARAPTW